MLFDLMTLNEMKTETGITTMRAKSDGAKRIVILLLSLNLLVVFHLVRTRLLLYRFDVSSSHESLTITKSSNYTNENHDEPNAKSHVHRTDSDISNSSNTSINRNKEEQPRIVVSFKTMPSRINHIEPTLSSLLTSQSMPVDKLYLVLPRTKWILTSTTESKNQSIHYEIPNFLKNLTHHDRRFEILRPEYDYGPVDKILYALQKETKQFESTHRDTKIIYLDDDVLYHKDVVQTLVSKSYEYPNSVVALSGCKLRSHFRQIAHRFPRQKFDKHPNLYFLLSGSESVTMDESVDIVQGFAGVLVRPSFFDVQEFTKLVRSVTRIHNVWKSDDFIISAYLEQKGVGKQIVASDALSTFHKPAATKNNLGPGMHRWTMQAAYDLQGRLGVWSQHEFVDYFGLDEYWRDLMDCEAGHSHGCQKAQGNNRTQVDNSKESKAVEITRQSATKLLDDYLLPKLQP